MSNSFTNQVIAQIELFGHTRHLREARLHAAQAPRREGRAAAPRRARRAADRADRRSRRPTSASRSRARTSPTTTATRRSATATAGAAESSMARPPAVAADEIADLALAAEGAERIAWAAGQMPVLAQIGERFARERPLAGVRVAACLHVTAETANLCGRSTGGRRAGRAVLGQPARRPRTTSPRRSSSATGSRCEPPRREARRPTSRHIARARRAPSPQITLDDGADLLIARARGRRGRRADRRHRGDDHRAGAPAAARGARELRCPVLAVNEARTERALNDRHGTGQSALDGIVRATNVLLAGHTLVVARLRLGRPGHGRARPRRRAPR